MFLKEYMLEESLEWKYDSWCWQTNDIFSIGMPLFSKSYVKTKTCEGSEKVTLHKM